MRTLYTRRMALAVSILLAGALTIFAAPAPPMAATIDKYLLDETDLLIVVEVKAILASPLFARQYRKPIEVLLKSEGGQALLKDAGFDPLRDIERIVIVMDRNCHPSKKSLAGAGPVFLVQGRFDGGKLKAKMSALAKSESLREIIDVQGEIYRLTFPNLPPRFLAQLDRNTLILSGMKEQVVEALDKASGKKKTSLKYLSIRAFLKARKPTPAVQVASDANAIWSTSYSAVIKPGGGTGPVKIHEQTTFADVGIRSLVGGFSVGEKLKGRGTLKTKDADKAKSIAKTLNNVLEEAKKELANMKELAPVTKTLESVTIQTRESLVLIDVETAGGFSARFIADFLLQPIADFLFHDPTPPSARKK